jgi:hypothetical protein
MTVGASDTEGSRPPRSATLAAKFEAARKKG